MLLKLIRVLITLINDHFTLLNYYFFSEMFYVIKLSHSNFIKNYFFPVGRTTTL